ncbi:MAG: DUF2397 family protein [Ruminococcus sp. SR1/5]|nr:DUF2397 family protein [Ruminococcus sp.]
MHKSFKYLAMTALASALIAGQATTAFAFKNDSNNGPGAAKTNEVSLQAPSDTSDNSQASGNNDSQTSITEDSSQPAGNSQSETSQTTENASNTTTENTTAAETVTEDTRTVFLQWITQANMNSQKTGRTEYGQEYRLIRKPEKCVLKCEDGKLVMPSYILEFK